MLIIFTWGFVFIVAAITLIALADILEARDDKLAELDKEGNAAIGLPSLLSGDDLLLCYNNKKRRNTYEFISNKNWITCSKY